MHRSFFALAVLSPVALLFAADSSTQFKYPPAPTSNQVDDYNGIKVADPYRPLENPDAPESRQWIEAENKITFDFLKTIPERDGIRKRLTEVWDYERFGVLFFERDAEPLVIPNFRQAFPDSVAFRNRFQKIEGDLVFGFDPLPRFGRVRIFERPIRIGDFDSIIIVHLITCRGRGIFKLGGRISCKKERNRRKNGEREETAMHKPRQ